MNDKLLQRVEEVMREVDDYYISRDHARAAASLVLEEAAKIADDKATELSQYRDTHCAVQAATAEDIAVAIRQLIPRQSA